MILIFFLCLKLSILHLSVSDLGYQCTRDISSNNYEIFLIRDRTKTHIKPPYYGRNLFDYQYLNLIGDSTQPFFRLESYQDILNTEFMRLCRNYYNITIGSLKDAKKHDNVIHFAVPDYYDGKLPKNFVYAGNVSKIDDAVCTKKDKAQPEFDCHEIANLVSKPVLEINDGHVYNFVQNMQITEYYHPFELSQSCEPLSQKTSDLTIVLLCLRGPDFIPKEVNIQLPLHLIQVADCSLNLNKNRILAVLAPEPFEVPSEYSVPTIFYETPYLFSEYKTAFPNSMNLVPWRLLKYGFLQFIQTMGWQRVAIVTDDSEYSLDFEDELTALFNKERIIYTVIRCEDANCEMDKIAQELNSKRVSPNIVIANVEEKHVSYLFQNTNRMITWLVRDMVGKRKHQYLRSHQNAFSISLSIDDTYTDGCDVEDNILTSLSSVAKAYQYISEKDYKLKKLDFYRRFANITKEVTPRITEATVVVNKLYGSEVILKMYVNATGVTLISDSFTDPFTFGKPTDGTAHCLLTSYDYHDPCEDPLVMFLMLTLMLFLLTFILIISYFDKTSPLNDIRYQNF